MTKEAFRYDMQRGLGSCIKELKCTKNREQFRPVILWGCSHDMEFNGQLEDRSVYLYELITEYPDCTPFIDVVEKNLFQNMKHRNWIFLQDCDILSFFTFDGNERALAILEKCYEELFQILLEKKKRADKNGFPERRNFEELCISFIKMCFDDTRKIVEYYKKIVNDIGTLIQKNALYSAEDFEWFQTVSEKELGKRKVHALLHHANISDATRAYVLSIKECREAEKEKAHKPHYNMARMLMKQSDEQEIVKFAEYYEKETDSAIRKKLLQQLVDGGCVWAIDPIQLIADSKSKEKELASYAFEALSSKKDAKVREYAFELLKSGQHMTEAVSMLATNYESTDCAFFAEMVKQIPITYDNGGWHEVFHRVMSLMRDRSVEIKPKELLPYMYHNTLCSFCREDVVKEMGRRRMLNAELLEELLYDCNQNIRAYAYKHANKHKK